MKATGLVLILLSLCAPSYGDEGKGYRPPWNASFATGEKKATENGFFIVAWTSVEMPVPVYAFHDWLLRVTSFDGLPVGEARIAVEAHMPAEDISMENVPYVRNLGGGSYLIGGMNFMKAGEWEVHLDISGLGLCDRVTFEVDAGRSCFSSSECSETPQFSIDPY